MNKRLIVCSANLPVTGSLMEECFYCSSFVADPSHLTSRHSPFMWIWNFTFMSSVASGDQADHFPVQQHAPIFGRNPESGAKPPAHTYRHTQSPHACNNEFYGWVIYAFKMWLHCPLTVHNEIRENTSAACFQHCCRADVGLTQDCKPPSTTAPTSQ